VSETYLITGATGLAGNHVLRELVNRGVDRDQIIGYDLEPREGNIEDIEDDITLIHGDITDTGAVYEAFEAHRPTRVIHLAALLVHDAWEDPTPTVEVNSLGTNTVFEACRVYDVDRCVYASTGGVYGTIEDYGGPENMVVDEENTVKPDSAYSASKYLNEVLGKDYDEHHNPEYVGVRIGGVWGRGRLFGATGEFTSFVRDAALGKDVSLPELWVSVYGASRDIYVSYGKDVGRWFVDLVDRDQLEHNLYNQRNEDPFTLTEVAAFLEQRIPETTVELVSEDEIENPAVTGTRPRLDASRWYDELGFEQEWSIEEALLDFVNYHREQDGLEPV
jgi:nucleoside-diphosphate-sugar epimerase